MPARLLQLKLSCGQLFLRVEQIVSTLSLVFILYALIDDNGAIIPLCIDVVRV